MKIIILILIVLALILGNSLNKVFVKIDNSNSIKNSQLEAIYNW